MKRMNSTSFQVWKNQKTLETFQKKKEVEEEVQRDLEVVKDCIVKVVQDITWLSSHFSSIF